MKLIIKDHRINLFYFISKDIDPTCLNYQKLIDIGLPDELLERWITNTGSKYAQKPLWIEINNYNISSHLIDNIHDLFHNGDQTRKIIKTYSLSQGAIELFNGKQIQENTSGKTFQLFIECNDASLDRLKSASCKQHPQLKIEEIYFHQFKTGSGVVCANLKLSNNKLNTALINEVVYNLSKINLLCWKTQTGKAACNTQTTLGKIIRQLLGNEEDFKKTRRVYTNTYIQFFHQASKLNTLKLIEKQQKELIRMARHRSLDYAISDKMVKQSIIFKDYDNIRHCISREGMATFIIIDQNSKPFLQNYYSGAILQAYIPLYLLAFHARETIQQILDQQIIWQPNQKIKQTDIELLQNRKKQLLNLNHTFFLDVISDEEIHNKLHRTLIQENHLINQYNKALEITNNTLQVIQDYQKTKQQSDIKKAKIEYCKIAKLGISLAAIPTVFSFINDVLNGFLAKQTGVAAGISLIFAILAGSLTYIAIQQYCQRADEPLD